MTDLCKIDRFDTSWASIEKREGATSYFVVLENISKGPMTIQRSPANTVSLRQRS
jgi:hypothetical protein